MPGRDYAQAWRGLEQSLRHSDYLRPVVDFQDDGSVSGGDDDDDQHAARAPLPHPTTHGTFFSSATPDIDAAVQSHQHTFFDQSYQNNPRLPPTPPSLSRFLGVPAPSNGDQNAQQNPSTPPNQQGGLPTPDVTPPVVKHQLAPLTTPHVETSNATLAESFATAREDWLSLSGGGSHLHLASPAADPHETVRVGSVSSSRADLREEHDASTVQGAEARFSATTMSPDLANDDFGVQVSPTRTHDTFFASTSTVNANAHLRSPKRTPSKSSKVQALIIDRSPPSVERKLRHTGKASDLRHACSQPNSPVAATAPTMPSSPRRSWQQAAPSSPLASSPISLRTLKRTVDQSSLKGVAAADAAAQAQPAPVQVPVTPKELSHLSPDLATMSPTRSKHGPRKSADISIRSLGVSTSGPTPVSARSEFSGPLELEEARAVQLYAHNNDSLVVVEHTPPQSSKITPVGIGLGGSNAPGSALLNPRTAPHPPPPVVVVSPPSQASGFVDDNDELLYETHEAPTADLPSRRPSFLTRAKAASTDMITSTTGSLRKSRARLLRREPGLIVQRTDSSRPPTGYSLDTSTFHQPSKFWPDQDDEAMVDGYPSVMMDASLPSESAVKDFAIGRGGEEDIGMLNNWRRGGSIRGFLIGNTLGISRGPTNRRRPVIILPSMADKRGRPVESKPPGLHHRRSASAPAHNVADRDAEQGELRSWWKALKASLRRGHEQSEPPSSSSAAHA